MLSSAGSVNIEGIDLTARRAILPSTILHYATCTDWPSRACCSRHQGAPADGIFPTLGWPRSPSSWHTSSGTRRVVVWPACSSSASSSSFSSHPGRHHPTTRCHPVIIVCLSSVRLVCGAPAHAVRPHHHHHHWVNRVGLAPSRRRRRHLLTYHTTIVIVVSSCHTVIPHPPDYRTIIPPAWPIIAHRLACT